MDMQLPESVSVRRKRRLLIIILLVIVSIFGAVWLMRRSLSSAISRRLITTAVVERGAIENTLTASGVVSPEFEAVIACPINASIQRVLLDAGSPVKPGQSILVLDKSASELAYEKLQFQLESGRNNIKKLKLELDKSYFDLQSNNDVKQLRINSLEAVLENARRLYKAGGGTREDVEQAELNLKVARLEKKQLENELLSKQQTMKVEMKESEIAAQIQDNDLRDLQRKLTLANIVSSRAGVVTWVNKNIGASVREGESLARIADLASFKITGNISDNYMDQLRNGMEVIVRINDNQLRGRIVNIYPAVQNGIISFDVQLDAGNNTKLRPDLKVDVFPVTAKRDNVLRVANGAAFKGAGTQDVFVVKDGTAVRRRVHVGMSNFDYVELLDNVQPGESIITSDMSEYANTNEIKLKP